jgi:hypothetical protein
MIYSKHNGRTKHGERAKKTAKKVQNRRRREMRKLVLFMHVSLDGYASDSNGGLGWVAYNEDDIQVRHNRGTLRIGEITAPLIAN